MEHATNAERDPASPIRVLGGVAAVAGALFATLIAYITDALLSTGDSGSHGTPLLTGQLIVAVVGVLPAGLFAWALYRRRNRLSVLWLTTGMVADLAWGVLNDASVHGWSHLAAL